MIGDGRVCGDWGVFAMVMVFIEVMLTSPTELAHCAPQGLPGGEEDLSNARKGLRHRGQTYTHTDGRTSRLYD